MRLLLAAFALLAGPCFAQGTATLSCTGPTKNTDGSNITSPVVYKFYRGTSPTALSNVSQGQSSCALVWTGLSAGTHYFAATATAGGVESAFSNVTSKLIAGGTNPVTVAGPVFNLAITTNSLVVLEAGSVVAGVPCDATQQVMFGGKSYMRVDASRVTPFQGQQILAAWATCQ